MSMRRPGTSLLRARLPATPRGGAAPARPRRREALLDRLQATVDRPELGAELAKVVGCHRPALIERLLHALPDRPGAGLGAPHELVHRLLRARPRGLRRLARGLEGALDRLADGVGQARRGWLAVGHERSLRGPYRARGPPGPPAPPPPPPPRGAPRGPPAARRPPARPAARP